MIKNAASVLRACVATLTVLGRGVMHAVKEFEEGGIGEFGGIEDDLKGFGVFAI